MRVAENRTANGTRRSGPRFEASRTVDNRPADETVNRDGGIGAHADPVHPRNLAALRMHDEAFDAGVGNQHIRAAAEERDRHTRLARDVERGDDLIAAAWLDKPFRWSAHPEGCEHAERDVLADALATKLALEFAGKVVRHADASRARSAFSRAMSADSASAAVHILNETVSPGAR